MLTDGHLQKKYFSVCLNRLTLYQAFFSKSTKASLFRKIMPPNSKAGSVLLYISIEPIITIIIILIIIIIIITTTTITIIIIIK